LIALLDVNVLVALAWPNHIHHARAQAWFGRVRDTGWATCPLTESSFVRVSSNTRAIPDARGPSEAIDLLRRIRAVPGHEFWIDDVSPVDSVASPGGATASAVIAPFDRLVGFRQVTDAHLLTLAIRRGGQLATFDQGIPDLLPQGADHHVVLID